MSFLEKSVTIRDPKLQNPLSFKFLKTNYSVSTRKILLITVMVAVLLRLVSALMQGNTVSELPGIYDQVSYDQLAQRIVAGYGFSFAENHWPVTQAGEPTAHWSFLYTLYLTAVYSFIGYKPIFARLLQAMIVGGLHTFLIYHIGKKTFSQPVGLFAAGITALYTYFIYYSGALMTESFYITAILLSLLLAMRITETNDLHENITLGIGLGVALGITIVLRQVFLLFIPFLFMWIWATRFRKKIGLPVISTTLSIIILVICIVPISLYNKSRFDRFVLLNTNSGYAFFWGNHPIYGTQFVPILPSAVYRDLIPDELLHLDEAALDQALLQRGIKFVLDDPKRYILLSISRIPAYFMFWPSSDSGLLSNISRVGSFGVMIPFMVYGLWLATRIKSLEKGQHIIKFITSPVGLLVLFCIVYTSIHILTWALIRYRLPVDAVLIVFAGLALYDLSQRVENKINSRIL